MELKEKYGVGTIHKTNEGYIIEIVEKIGRDKRRIKFENGYEVDVLRRVIMNGAIKNPYHPSVCGIGYFGIGDYKAYIEGKQTSEYGVWTNMLKRCYDEKHRKKFPTYKGVSVCSEWHNFQNFAKWYEDNKPKIDNIVFDLDKDLLQQNLENKIYNPYDCIFLPHSVNSFLANKQLNNTSGYTGVFWYKSSKKKWEARINLFGEGKKQKYLGRFFNFEDALEIYKEARVIETKKVKEYLRSLDYLSEEVINLIK